MFLRHSAEIQIDTSLIYKYSDLMHATTAQFAETHLYYPDFKFAAHRIPRGVFCLISALAFHELTTEIPHFLYIALPRQMQKPRIDTIPIRYFWYSPASYDCGIETYETNGGTIKVYNPAKTVTDCFKFRHKIGKDVAIASLKTYLAKSYKPADLFEYAEINRVLNVMTPYIEALTI